MPGLHEFIGLREYLNINRAEFRRHAVIKQAGLGRVAFIADAPGDFKAENMLFALGVSDIG